MALRQVSANGHQQDTLVRRKSAGSLPWQTEGESTVALHAAKQAPAAMAHLGDALEHLLLGHLVCRQLGADNGLHLVHELHIVLRHKAQRPALQPIMLA
jgi:hypothetical protein